MSADTRRVRALRLVRDALDVTDRDREAWLARECSDDVALRNEVQRLLDADRDANGPLDRPLSDFAAATSSADDPRLGRRVGPFVLRALLGRGGMGAVYRAERSDGGFAQTVALKLLRASDGDDALARRRFARERQILVRLQHPHIARFLDGGVTDDGQPWYAMELVEGETITQHLDRVRADVPARLALLMQVCDAVQFAHQNLVLHRDLKPANILVDAQGEVKLLDFGIAKLLHADTDPDAGAQTRTEHRAFTPDYAAPEQIEGGAVSTATDLYALGVLAFELLTGRRPFRRSGLSGLASDTGNAEAPSRALLREGGDARRAAALRGDLDTIVLACLQSDPARRYPSAAALKRDLERYLDGLPIEARPDSFGYRASKFVRRHRLGVVAGGALALALVVATFVSISQARRAEHESARAAGLAASAQRERDAALDEARRQEMLREHFVVVLNRATQSGEPITPDALMTLAANPRLLGEFGDAQMQAALQLAISDLLLQRGDYPRTLELLDQLEPTLGDAPGRVAALAASNRAYAAIRVGQLDVAEAALERGSRLMTPEQRAGGLLEARLLMLRGQLLRARGDLDAAATATRDAATRAFAATDGTALERGTLIGTGATGMLLVGDLDATVELADRAEAVWRDANVSENFSTSTLATQRANALFLRGNLLDALATIEAIDAAATGTESAPARAARASTQAKLLALLARRDEALALIDGAIRGICDSVGRDSLDCLRVKLSGVDTRVLAGDLARAQRELDALQPALATQPPLLASGTTFGRVLALRLTPNAQTLAAAQQALVAGAAAGALPRRNAVRSLLMLAETMQHDGRADDARALARSALDIAGDTIDGDGMDPSLLDLWRARLQSRAPPPAALAALERALGSGHPLVVRWREP